MNGLVYNEINLGFATLQVYTSEKGVERAIMKSSTKYAYDFEVPKEEIYSEKVGE
jgi:hypothetical protein|tara:strand:+ start:286 stop:450 length:165 start_codon:yes stop_codon:yes gene_type:complete